MLVFPPPKFSRRRKFERRVEKPAPPAQVTVVSVSAAGGQQALWVFSSPVVSAESVLGLSVSSSVPDSWEITEEGALLVTYFDEVSVGAEWDVEDADPIVMSFASGQELLVPQSGNVNA